VPKTQTLHLNLDLTKDPGKKHGQFAADAKPHRSKVWIDHANNAISYKKLPLNFADNVAVSIEIGTQLPANWQLLDIGGTCLQVAVVLWRKTGVNDATFDSPFTDNNLPGGQVKTVFDQSYTRAQLPAGSGLLPLGTPQKNSGTPGNVDRYMFLVAVKLNVQDDNYAPLTFTATQDPQMDVGL